LNKPFYIIWFIAALLIGSAGSVPAQTPAFPGALGFGAYATGGRGGAVVHVTNLNDSGAGSFRDAVSHSGRIVVFDVGGHVTFSSAVSVQGNTTIAGQTAPGGICFDGGEISFSPRANIVCRYIRIRPGSATASTGDDCLSLYQSTNCILDHCSFEFGPWNNIDAVTANNISVQHCINANPTYQQFGAHTENLGAFFCWTYNIFANSHNRNPLAKINTIFINNLDYNCSAGYTTHTSSRFKHDIVNNYFVAGPASSSSNFPWYQIDNNQSMYFSGNLYDANKNTSLDGSITAPLPGYQGGGTILSAPWSSWTAIIPTASADLAWRYDVSTAGAFPRDDVDSLLISQVITLGNGSSGTGGGTAGPDGGLYTSQSQTGLPNNGYGTFTGLDAPANASGDGIADYWKLASNLSTNISYPLTNTASAYCLLENYLNFLGAPHAVTQTNTPVDINLAQFTSGFGLLGSATLSLTNATNGTASLLNGTNAHFIPSANFSGLGSFDFYVTEGSYKLGATVTICVTPIAPPPAATSFNGALMAVVTNASATAIALPSNLTWRGDGVNNFWNSTTSNWLNGNVLAAFKNGDAVAFDDTGSNSPAITVSGTVAPAIIVFDADRNYTISGSGAWSGSGALTKNGSGVVFINTTNSSYTGAIALNSGAIVLGQSASVGSGTLTLNSGTLFGLAVNGGTFPANPVFIPGGQTGTITNTGIANGMGGAISSGDSTSVLNLPTGLSFTATSASQFNGFTGTITINPGATLRFSANSSGNTYGSLNPNWIVNGILQPRNAGNTISLGSISGTGSLQGPQTAGTGTGNTVFNIGGNNLSSVFSGTILSNANSAGSAICVNKLGAGALTLNGNNSFTGTNAVLAGALFLNGANSLSLCTVFSDATLGGTGTLNGIVRVNSGGTLSPGAAGVGSLGTFTINNHLTNATPTLKYDLSGNPVGANDLVEMTGTLAMSGAQSFVFNLLDGTLGTGTYNLIEGASNSTQSGVALAHNLPGSTRQTISLFAAAPGSNPSYVRLSVSGPPAVTNLIWQGTNGYNWDTITTNWTSAAGADAFYNLDWALFDDSGSNAQPVNLATALAPAVIRVSAAKDYTFSGAGALSGPGPLTKSGSGTLTITTTNSSYTGNIFVTGGTLQLVSGAGIGSGLLTISGGGTFGLPSGGNSLFIGNNVTVPATATANITSGVLSSGFSGNFYSGNSNSVLSFGSSQGFSVSGTTSAQFDGFTGTINIQSGATLRYSASSSGNTYGSLNPTFVINGSMRPRNAGNTIALGALSGWGSLDGPQSNGGSGDTLYLIGGNNSDANFSGVISSNTAVAGSEVIVQKIGLGRLTLTGASTYTGGTTVSAGTLRANNTSGSATGTGDLEVFSGATLTGNGAMASNTTIDDGATLAPGDPAGTLTFSGNLTLGDNSTLQFRLGTNSSRVVVNGDLFLTGQLNVTNGGGFGPGAYTLFTCSGAMTASENLTVSSAPAGYNYHFDTAVPSRVKLVVVDPLAPPPAFGTISFSGTALTMTGTGGVPNANFCLLTSTNLSLQATNWTRLLTNQFDSGGNFSITLSNIAPNQANSFYRLQSQ
jgi:autotransporter-associated beta strand protein